MAVSMDSILKLSRSKKILILAVLLIAMLGIYYMRFYVPQQDEINALDGELSKLLKELDESKAINRDLEKFKGQVEKLNAELLVAQTQFPNEKEIPEVLKSISSLGRESNLEFVLFRPKPEEPQQFYARVPIELTIVGNYHNTGTFFDRVGKQPRIINVVDFTMARSKDARGSDSSVRTSCLITTYRFLEKKGEENKSGQKTTSATTGEGGPNVPKK